MLIGNIAEQALAFNIPGIVVDGNDAPLVYEVVSKAVARARAGAGPTLVEGKTYRWRGHTLRDEWHEGGYRSVEEIEGWKKCPIRCLEVDLIAAGILRPDEVDHFTASAKQEMEEATAFAIDSPLPTLPELLEVTYA